MVAREQTLGLQRGTDGTRLVVDLAPGHLDGALGTDQRVADETDAGAGVGGVFEPCDGRIDSDHRVDATYYWLPSSRSGR